jgi:hypothetical protein
MVVKVKSEVIVRLILAGDARGGKKKVIHEIETQKVQFDNVQF